MVAVHTPHAGGIGLHTVPAADTDALAGLVERTREALERERGVRPRVLCGYEAGYEGFWLARRLPAVAHERFAGGGGLEDRALRGEGLPRSTAMPPCALNGLARGKITSRFQHRASFTVGTSLWRGPASPSSRCTAGSPPAY